MDTKKNIIYTPSNSTKVKSHYVGSYVRGGKIVAGSFADGAGKSPNPNLLGYRRLKS
jgi:hypothetical protein